MQISTLLCLLKCCFLFSFQIINNNNELSMMLKSLPLDLPPPKLIRRVYRFEMNRFCLFVLNSADSN